MRYLPLLLVVAAVALCQLAASELPRATITTNHGVIVVELDPSAAPVTVRTFLGLAEGTQNWHDPRTRALIQRPYYDNTTFHRVIPGFMIQGGDIKGDGTGGTGFTFEDEINGEGLGLGQIQVYEKGQMHATVNYMADAFVRAAVAPRMAEMGITPESPRPEQQNAFDLALQQLDGNYTALQFYQDLGYKYNNNLTTRRLIRGALCMANRGPNTNAGQFFINVADTPHLDGKHTVFGRVISGMEVVDAIAQVTKDDRDRPIDPVVIESIRRVVAQPAPTEPANNTP